MPFKSDRQRKAAFANMNSGKQGINRNQTVINSNPHIKSKKTVVRGNPHVVNSQLKSTVTVARLGDIFGKNLKEKNAWKKRMLEAGLKKKGLSFPDDWDKLSEKEKEKRLNQAMNVFEKDIKESKKPVFIKEPFGLPRELQPTGKFQRNKVKDVAPTPSQVIEASKRKPQRVVKFKNVKTALAFRSATLREGKIALLGSREVNGKRVFEVEVFK